MQDFLFDPPFVWPAIAFVVGLGVFLYGNARVKAPVRNLGLGLIALVVAWCVTAYFVQTPLEKAVSRTRAIVSTVTAKDWAKLPALFDPDTRMASLASGDAIAKAAESAAGTFGLTDIRVLSQAASRGGPYTVDVTINTLVEASMNTPAVFTFQYNINRDGSVRLTRIVPVSVGGTTGDDLTGRIGR